MYGIQSLQRGGVAIPRPRPEELAPESLAPYKMTPREQKSSSDQGADTQVLIDSFLAEQQRGVDETELDMVVEQEAGEGKDPVARLGYMVGNIYGVPVGTVVTNRVGSTERTPGDLRAFVEQNTIEVGGREINRFDKQFIPRSKKLSAFADLGSSVLDPSVRGLQRTVDGMSFGGRRTIRHELSHLAFANPELEAALDDLPLPLEGVFERDEIDPEETYIRVKDYVLSKDAGQEDEEAAEWLRGRGIADPYKYYEENAETFDKIEDMAKSSIRVRTLQDIFDRHSATIQAEQRQKEGPSPMTNVYNRRMFRMAAGGMVPPAMEPEFDEADAVEFTTPEQEAQIYQAAQDLPPEVIQQADESLNAMAGDLAMEEIAASAQEEAQRSIQNVNAAGDFREIMNAVWDQDADIGAYRDRLASVVGPDDAAMTPDSVLALIQPTLQLAEIDQGVGSLMQQELAEIGDMGGIASLAAKGAVADSMAAETGGLVNAVGNLAQGQMPMDQGPMPMGQGPEGMPVDPMMLQAMMQGAGPMGQGMA